MHSPSSLRRSVTGALCALLLLFAGGLQTSADDKKPLTAILLVARPELPDSDFADSVVLVLNNLADAPAGLIINRPTKLMVTQLFPDVKRLALLHDKVYFGGPVELDSVWFLFRSATRPQHAIPACDGVYLSSDKDLLLKLLGREHPMDGLRIFLGHSGWGPGQLETEIAHGDWKLQRVDPSAIFSKPEHPWPPAAAPDQTAAPNRST
jgi:putative transcriptional regulator